MIINYTSAKLKKGDKVIAKIYGPTVGDLTCWGTCKGIINDDYTDTIVSVEIYEILDGLKDLNVGKCLSTYTKNVTRIN